MDLYQVWNIGVYNLYKYFCIFHIRHRDFKYIVWLKKKIHANCWVLSSYMKDFFFPYFWMLVQKQCLEGFSDSSSLSVYLLHELSRHCPSSFWRLFSTPWKLGLYLSACMTRWFLTWKVFYVVAAKFMLEFKYGWRVR